MASGNPSGEKRHEERPLTGGLITSRPPHMLPKGSSPELLNVIEPDDAVARRGGFNLALKERARLNSLCNEGKSYLSRETFADDAENRPYLSVPGLGVAFHDPIYNRIADAYSIDFFFSPKNLITEVGINALTYSGTEPGIKVRPILSKGPLKKTEEVDAAYGYGLINGTSVNETGNGPSWNNAASLEYGAVMGMPFCVYLYNDGTMAAPDWKFRFSVHARGEEAGSATTYWWLKTCETVTTEVREDSIYHIIVTAVSAGTMRLRIAEIIADQTPVYETITNDLSSGHVDHKDLTLAQSFCPIQIFDCPQAFIENTQTAPTDDQTVRGTSTSLRPGLDFNGTTYSPDPVNYFSVLRRAEGRIEDIAIWKNDQLASDTAALDRLQKISPEAAGDDLVTLWSMAEPGEKIVRDISGRGTDVLLAPAGPVYSDGVGTLPDGSWWFNGLTSFAQCDLGDDDGSTTRGNPNWWAPTYAGTEGFWSDLIRNPNGDENRDFGIEITFWPGSIEPGFEQVLFEIHDTIRLAIDIDGKLAVYYATKPDGIINTQNNWYNDTAIKSELVLRPGQRYTVTVMKTTSEGEASPQPFGRTRIYVNNELVAYSPAAGGGSEEFQMSTTGAITWGMGSVERLHIFNAAIAPSGGPTHHVNFDSRSGFVGIIESARVICGIPIDHAPYKDDALSEDYYAIEELWQVGSTTVQSQGVDPLTAGAGEVIWNPDDDSLTTLLGRLERRQGLALALDHEADQGYRTSADISGTSQLLEKRKVRYVQETDATLPQTRYQHRLAILNAPQGGQTVTGDDSRRNHMRLLHTLGRWDFNRRDVDDEATYPGFYLAGWERRSELTQVTPAVYSPRQDNLWRWIHIQETGVDDRHKCLGPVLRGCIESDIRREFWERGADNRRPAMAMPGVDVEGTTFLKPYSTHSPKELQPCFKQGMVSPYPGTCPLTLIADWQVPSSLERFRIIAAGRWIAWAKPAWRVGTPFSADALGTKSLWFFGQKGEHARMLATDDENQAYHVISPGNTDLNLIHIDVWVYPDRLDGKRLIALKRGGSGSELNYLIYSEDGAVHVVGTMGGNTSMWRTRSVTQLSATVGNSEVPEVALRLREWNHVHIRLGRDAGTPGTSERTIWVNGILVPTTDDLDTISPGVRNPDYTGVSTELYLGGPPLGELSHLELTYAGGPSTIELEVDAWHGMISEFRQTEGVEDAGFDDITLAGVVPKARATADNDTYYLLPLNEGEFWNIVNSAVAASSGHSCTKEIIPLREDLDESTGAPYRWVVFRDRLYVTNGRSRPQEIIFTRFSDPEGAFRCHDAGILAPVLHRQFNDNINGTGVGTATPTTPTPTASGRTPGIYSVWVSFVDEDGRESDPTLIYRFQIPAGPNASDEIVMNNIPRSTHPRVVARRIYASPQGGGTALFHDTIADNKTRSYELWQWPIQGAQTVRPGYQLPMPRGRQIEVVRSSVVIADLTEEANGSNSFDFSLTEEPVYFAADTATVIDSADGKPIIGLRAHLGRAFFSKRDSIWALAFAGITSTGDAETYLTLINKSVGVGAGDRLYDDMIFGAGDRGIYQFNGGDTVYVSEALEEEWRAIDRSDNGLRNMWGVFYRPNSLYLLSARRTGEVYNDTIYVLNLSTLDPRTRTFPWTKLTVPEHTYLQEVIDEDDQEPQLLMGSANGQLLIYRPDIDSDVAAEWSYDNQTVLLVDSVVSVSADKRTVTVTGPLDTLRDGLVGTKAKFSTSGEVRTVLSNTATTVTFTEALVTTVATDTMTLGGFAAYWTSGWLEPQTYGKGLRVQWLDLDFVPTATPDIVAEWIHARETQPASRSFAGAAQTASADSTVGYLKNPISIKDQQWGRYFRVKVGTEGVLKPFVLAGFGLRWIEVGTRGNP